MKCPRCRGSIVEGELGYVCGTLGCYFMLSKIGIKEEYRKNIHEYMDKRKVRLEGGTGYEVHQVNVGVKFELSQV